MHPCTPPVTPPLDCVNLAEKVDTDVTTRTTGLSHTPCTDTPTLAQHKQPCTDRTHSRKKLDIIVLNVCGLKSKVICPDFLNLFKSCHIFVLTESKLDDADNELIEN